MRVSGEESAFNLWWLGGACERDTTVRLTSAAGAGIHLDIRTERGLVGSCPAVGIYRIVGGRTLLPLDLFEIGISYEPG